jgi:hypothetical protein
VEGIFVRALTMAAGCTVSIQPDDDDDDDGDDADVELDVDFDRRRDRAPDSAPAALTGASFPARDRRIAGDHLHGYMPADLPSQPFGDPAHLIDDTVQMLDPTGGAGALRSTAPDLSRFFDARIRGAHGGSTRGFTTLTTVRPGARDITVMVAPQGSAAAHRPWPGPSSTRPGVCGNGSRGRHRDTERRKRL